MKRIQIITALSLLSAVSAHAIDVQEYTKLVTEYAQNGASLASGYLAQATTYAAQAKDIVMSYTADAYNYSCNIPVGKVAAGVLATGVAYKASSKLAQSLAYRSVCTDLDTCYSSIAFAIKQLNHIEPKLRFNSQDVISSINRHVEILQRTLIEKNVKIDEKSFQEFLTSLAVLCNIVEKNNDNMQLRYMLDAGFEITLFPVKVIFEDIKLKMIVDTATTLKYIAKKHAYTVGTLLGAGAAFVAYKKGYTLNDVSALATSAYDAISKKAATVFAK